MKIVDEKLETRNLGVKTISINIDTYDEYNEVENAIKETEAEYLVLKIPSIRTDLTPLAHKFGYIYVEDMVFMEHDLHEIQRTSLQQRLYDSVKAELMQQDDYNVLYDEIARGSFSFDRISNDPYFGQNIANRRFLNWLNDEKERGAEFWKMCMNGEMRGFFTLREIRPQIYDSALGGIFMKWRKGGMGTNVKVPDIVKKKGGKKVVSGVSTNNVIQIRALVQNGYFPVRINHVFIKHTDINNTN